MKERKKGKRKREHSQLVIGQVPSLTNCTNTVLFVGVKKEHGLVCSTNDPMILL
jgi:hypothetical protein